jgi:hypothetical protein
MAAQTFDLTGERKITQGETYKVRVRMSSPTLDLSAGTVRAQIRRKYSDSDALCSFTVAMGTDLTGRYADLTLSDTTTGALPVSVALDYQKRSTFYTWDLFLDLADRKICLVEGDAEVNPRVTRT